MEERLTIKQVLVMTRDLLRGIGQIPIEEAEHIGIPVIRAIANLEECIKAINEDESRSAESMQEEAQEEANEDTDVQ